MGSEGKSRAIRVRSVISIRRITASEGSGRLQAEELRGELVEEPVVGRPIAVLREAGGDRFLSSPVRRVSLGEDGQTLYVQTQNSVYFLSSS